VYVEIVDDAKLLLLSPADRWYFISILALKSDGVLDGEDAELRRRMVQVKLRLDAAELEELARRLDDVGLICRETYQPVAWDYRQRKSDHDNRPPERLRKWRDEKKKTIEPEVNQKRTGIEPRPETETETETETEKRKTLRAPEGVSKPVWTDFLKTRNRLRAAVTQTAIDGIAREAKKAGIPLEDVLRLCCERGWRSFKADWVATGAVSTVDPLAWTKTATGIREKGRELGLDPDRFVIPDGTKRQDWQAFRTAVLTKAGVV
jgi:hypothetical protein